MVQKLKEQWGDLKSIFIHISPGIKISHVSIQNHNNKIYIFNNVPQFRIYCISISQSLAHNILKNLRSISPYHFITQKHEIFTQDVMTHIQLLKGLKYMST